jgi:hypothetical protein
MKRVFLLPVFIFIAFSFISCEDEDLSPLPVKVSGQFMKLDIKTKQLHFDDFENAAFTGTLSNPSGDVVKYELFVRRYDKDNFLTSDYVPLLTVTSFPYELVITPQMIADALGLQVSDLKESEKYAFYANSYNANGNKANYSSMARIIQVTDTMEQGYRFNTDLSNNSHLLVNFDNHDTAL